MLKEKSIRIPNTNVETEVQNREYNIPTYFAGFCRKMLEM
jgi:hypothetical protein